MVFSKVVIGTLSEVPDVGRINIQHRLVYEIFRKEKTVRILRMWTHYE